MAAKRTRPQVKARALHARQRAVLEKRRRARAQRLKAVAAVVAVIAAIGLVAFIVVGTGDDEGTDVAASSTTTAPGGSAAGKPCVAAEPGPAGAPAVPVKVGPPPAALVAEDLKPGSGAVVAAGQALVVNYIGVACSTGKVFDSSYERNQPASFSLSGVIEGWQQGIPGMMVGGQRLLGIPPALGYKDRGSGTDIGPGETLWFIVEVLEAKAA